MVQTRSVSSSPVKKTRSAPSTSTTTSANTWKPTAEPLRLIVAPKSISQSARFITLHNPVDFRPRRYLFCPTSGVFELTKTDVPKHDPRSVLFAAHEEHGQPRPKAGTISYGYINRSAEYMTATPYDMCFTLLPIVADSAKDSLFQSLDDFLDSSADETFDLAYVVQHSRGLMGEALELICDTIEAGHETMYRYSQRKTLKLIISKAMRACQNGLPASLEEKFVVRALEAPVLSVRREESTTSLSRSDTEQQGVPDRTNTPTPSESFDSQSSAASAAPSVVFSEASVATTTTVTTLVPQDTISDNIMSLQRLLTAFKFIAATYTTPTISATLLTALKSPASGIDFTPLTDHLSHLAKLRAEAAASANLSSFSRKRGSLEDDEEAEMRAEKKRKLSEEQKRKKENTSHGVKQLAKVDVKGMKKMSAFFTPKVAKGKR